MGWKNIYFLFMMLAFGLTLKGQVPDTLRNSLSGPEQLKILREIPDEIVMLNILNLHSQIMDNMMQMMGILYVEHQIIEAKIDSILNSLKANISVHQVPNKKNLSAEELRNADTYFSIKKAILSPLTVFKLDLSKNTLKSVPEEIKQFTNLQELILSENLLVELPDWISHLKALQYIYLSNNRFEYFPESITKIYSLILVDLSCNPIRTITLDVNELPNLKVLNLHDSKIDHKEFERLELTHGGIIIK